MWDTFWHFLWSTIVIFAFIAYLMILFNILTDLFWRDHQTSGWIKAVWVIFLILFPYLTAIVYLIARGNGMAERARAAAVTPSRPATTTSSRPQAGPPRRRSPTRRHCWRPARSRQAEFDASEGKGAQT